LPIREKGLCEFFSNKEIVREARSLEALLRARMVQTFSCTASYAASLDFLRRPGFCAARNSANAASAQLGQYPWLMDSSDSED